MSATHDVGRLLVRARAAWRGAEITQGICLWLAPLLLALVLLFVLDNLLHLGGGARLVLGLLWILGLVAGFVALVLPRILRRRSVEATARLVEERLEVPGNVLINQVQLGAEAKNREGRIPEAAVREVAARAERAAARVDVGRLWKAKPLRRALGVASGALSLLLLYAVIFPDHAANAVARYRSPFGETMPLTDTRLLVLPGDVTSPAGTFVTVAARVQARRGDVAKTATLEVRGPGAPWEQRSMALAEDGAGERVFQAGLGPLDEDLVYRVVAGDAESRVFAVTVVQAPSVSAVDLRLLPPAYTGRAAEEIRDPAVVRGLAGTEVQVRFEVDRAPLRAELEAPDAEPVSADLAGSDRRASFAFGLDASGTLALALADADRAAELAVAWSAPVTVLADAAPKVRLEAEAPSLILPPGTALALTARAEDDVGLAGLRFLVERASTKQETALKTWRYAAPGVAKAVERLVVPLDAATFRPGETYRFLAEAGDHHPSGEHVARSDSVLVRIARAGELSVPDASALAAPFERLRQLVEKQRTSVAQTSGLVELRDEHVRKGRFAPRAVQMATGQREIRPETLDLAKAFARAPGGAAAADVLLGLEDGALADLDSVLAAVTPGALPGAIDRALAGALPLQRHALGVLEGLLGRLALQAAEAAREDEVREEAGGRSLEEELRRQAERLREFLDEQRRIVALSRELEQKNPEDWSEEDERLLGRLEAQELKWATFFEEAFTDLSKVPDQDFAGSELLDEFNQVYMEVKKAADALSERKVELAVPLEQSGLELAERMEHNLERWIPDTPDHTKWVMEEPEGDFEVPLADLPDELEDIVGDLIDEADEMDEDVEDLSSSWMDSLDKGAGWDATDGPISNMSARGITGNRLPNTNEVGGRSGEGRTGRSHGQFVEKTAEGKGGRETPTRLTEDAFESGSVQDRSNEAQGGATGAGKLAGEGMEGLRGRVPPDVGQQLQRLANRQGELRQQAERLARVLRKLHLPAGDVDDAAKLLAWSENHLENAEGFDLRTAHTNVKAALERARASLRYEADTLREAGADLPDRVRDELYAGLRRGLPTGYEDVLRAYYRAVAEGR